MSPHRARIVVVVVVVVSRLVGGLWRIGLEEREAQRVPGLRVSELAHVVRELGREWRTCLFDRTFRVQSPFF